MVHQVYSTSYTLFEFNTPKLPLRVVTLAFLPALHAMLSIGDVVFAVVFNSYAPISISLNLAAPTL